MLNRYIRQIGLLVSWGDQPIFYTKGQHVLVINVVRLVCRFCKSLLCVLLIAFGLKSVRAGSSANAHGGQSSRTFEGKFIVIILVLRMRMLESRSWLRIGGVLEYAVKMAYGLDNKIQTRTNT